MVYIKDYGIYDADDYDDHEWPFACNILDWRGFDQRCTGYAGKIHIILGYGCIFLVCNAGCHVVHDAGYDIYYVAAKRILEVLDTEPSIEDGTRDTFPVMKDGEVEFKDVSFKYPDAEEYVLEHISFSAKKGETIAFIGATGCGKRTAINLIHTLLPDSAVL